MEHLDSTIKRLWPPCAAPSPAAPSPAAAWPRVYAVSIAQDAFAGTQHWGDLGPEDEARAAAIASPKRRAQFAAGRKLLQQVLQNEVGSDASGWQVRRRGNGQLHASLGATPAAVSVSHSGALAMCAVAPAGGLGVDVEMCRPRRSGWSALAEAVLHPLERSRLDGQPEAERWHGFYRLWTLKEAFSKGLGLGLGLEFARVAFSSDDRLLVLPDPYAAIGSSWQFASFAVGPGAVGAVAWSAR